MIEKSFLDRVPTYPGRVTLTPVSGQANVYDMTRSDSPTEEGTPLNKATFDSIVQSRLTGRYYQPAVSREILSNVSGTVSPVPTSGWINATSTGAQNGVYVLSSSETFGAGYGPAEAFNGSWTTGGGWRSANNDENPWIAVDLGSPITLTKIKTHYTADYTATACAVQGSNNGTSWTTIGTISTIQTAATETSFSNTTAYRYYRLSFNNVNVRLYEWEFTGYTVTTYKNTFTVSGWPTEWTDGQRAMVQIPANVVTLGVVSNAINGVTVNTILQPGKRYELRYTGSAFAAKEV